MSDVGRVPVHSPWSASQEPGPVPLPERAPSPAGRPASRAARIDRCRIAGLALAVELYARRDHGGDLASQDQLAGRVTETAGRFSDWLLARPARLRLHPSPFTFAEGTPGPGVPTITTGETGMSVTMTDDQEVTYACEPEDDKGAQVADTLTWSESSGGAVVTATPSADGLSCAFAAVAPGTSTITVTDGTLSGTDLITVTPGAVASLVLTPGTPVAETPAS
jgi:hypothetical protein